MQLLVCKRQCFESMAIFAPNINSYRRFLPDQFVPVNSENKFQIIDLLLLGFELAMKSPRIEHRVAGAEANALI